MTDPDVARTIHEMIDRDTPIELEARRREIVRMWASDCDAQILATVIETKIRRLQRAN